MCSMRVLAALVACALVEAGFSGWPRGFAPPVEGEIKLWPVPTPSRAAAWTVTASGDLVYAGGGVHRWDAGTNAFVTLVPETQYARAPWTIAYDSVGRLVAADQGAITILYPAGGMVTTVPTTVTLFNGSAVVTNPRGVVVLPDGSWLVASDCALLRQYQNGSAFVAIGSLTDCGASFGGATPSNARFMTLTTSQSAFAVVSGSPQLLLSDITAQLVHRLLLDSSTFAVLSDVDAYEGTTSIRYPEGSVLSDVGDVLTIPYSGQLDNVTFFDASSHRLRRWSTVPLVHDGPRSPTLDDVGYVFIASSGTALFVSKIPTGNRGSSSLIGLNTPTNSGPTDVVVTISVTSTTAAPVPSTATSSSSSQAIWIVVGVVLGCAAASVVVLAVVSTRYHPLTAGKVVEPSKEEVLPFHNPDVDRATADRIAKTIALSAEVSPTASSVVALPTEDTATTTPAALTPSLPTLVPAAVTAQSTPPAAMTTSLSARSIHDADDTEGSKGNADGVSGTSVFPNRTPSVNTPPPSLEAVSGHPAKSPNETAPPAPRQVTPTETRAPIRSDSTPKEELAAVHNVASTLLSSPPPSAPTRNAFPNPPLLAPEESSPRPPAPPPAPGSITTSPPPAASPVCPALPPVVGSNPSLPPLGNKSPTPSTTPVADNCLVPPALVSPPIIGEKSNATHQQAAVEDGHVALNSPIATLIGSSVAATDSPPPSATTSANPTPPPPPPQGQPQAFSLSPPSRALARRGRRTTPSPPPPAMPSPSAVPSPSVNSTAHTVVNVAPDLPPLPLTRWNRAEGTPRSTRTTPPPSELTSSSNHGTPVTVRSTAVQPVPTVEEEEEARPAFEITKSRFLQLVESMRVDEFATSTNALSLDSDERVGLSRSSQQQGATMTTSLPGAVLEEEPRPFAASIEDDILGLGGFHLKRTSVRRSERQLQQQNGSSRPPTASQPLSASRSSTSFTSARPSSPRKLEFKESMVKEYRARRTSGLGGSSSASQSVTQSLVEEEDW